MSLCLILILLLNLQIWLKGSPFRSSLEIVCVLVIVFLFYALYDFASPLAAPNIILIWPCRNLSVTLSYIQWILATPLLLYRVTNPLRGLTDDRSAWLMAWLTEPEDRLWMIISYIFETYLQ
jgi:hypothetical protein